jgi:hypothetical protein
MMSAENPSGRPVRVALDEAAFRELVAGRIARLPLRPWPHGEDPPVAVEIILSDIGWDRMQAAIDAAQREALSDPS